MNLTSESISDEMYSIAAKKENILKTRDRRSLPCKYSNKMKAEILASNFPNVPLLHNSLQRNIISKLTIVF